MRVFVAASAVQITYGLSNFLSSHIKAVKIYPDIYYSKLYKANFKGHYHPKGFIFMSYKHFKQGYENEKDGINLGIHEMAHALYFYFENINEYKFLFKQFLDEWIVRIKDKNEFKSQAHPDGFFRSYSITNANEFFSVCVENFFEKPNELNRRIPKLYRHLCFLLNQNPLDIDLNEKEEIVPDEYEKPIFQEKVSILLPASLIIVSLLITYGLYDSGSDLFPFSCLISITVFFKAGYKTFTAKQVQFFDNYIIIRHFLSKKTIRLIPNKSLLYIATYNRSSRNSRNLVISLAHHDNRLMETYDSISRSSRFQQNVKHYCNRRSLIYFDKANGFFS